MGSASLSTEMKKLDEPAMRSAQWASQSSAGGP